jgi:hypothetical protein
VKVVTRKRDIAGRVNDTLSYVLVFAPEFPSEDQTTTEEQCDRLLMDVHELWNGLQDVERRRWLDLVGRDIVDARRCFLSGDSENGRSGIESAIAHLKAWREGKAVRPSFIVGQRGETEKAD